MITPLTLFTKFERWLFPHFCVLCLSPSTKNIDLCEGCKHDLPWMMAVGQTAQSALMQNLDFIFSPFRYDAPLSNLILDLKFKKKLSHACVLGELMAETLEQAYLGKELPEYIIPVPLHKKRLQERGYNQALELARPISKRLKIPINFVCCQRARPTLPQSSLPAKSRHNNIKQAFAVTEPLPALHVAIVDDVMTTGHTVSELAATLKASGAKTVDVWCCARTLGS